MKKYLRRLSAYVDELTEQGDRIGLRYLREFLQLEADLLEEKSIRFLKKNPYVTKYLVGLVDESNEVVRDGILEMKDIFGKRGIKILLRREYLRNLILDIERSIKR